MHCARRLNCGRRFLTLQSYRDASGGVSFTCLVLRNFGQYLSSLADLSIINEKISLPLYFIVINSCGNPSFLSLLFPFVASGPSLVPCLLLGSSFSSFLLSRCRFGVIFVRMASHGHEDRGEAAGGSVCRGDDQPDRCCPPRFPVVQYIEQNLQRVGQARLSDASCG